MQRSANLAGNVGDYQVLELLNDSPSASLYKARRIGAGIQGISQGQQVCLQHIPAAGHPLNQTQFKSRTEALRRMKHNHIARYLDDFIWRKGHPNEEACCLVMDLFEGESVASLLERNGAGLPWAKAKAIFEQVLQALGYAAQCEVKHGNLSLSSIYVSPTGSATLIGFGLVLEQRDQASPGKREVLSTGSIDYLAPDLAKMPSSFAGDEQSDIFSLAACLFHAMTGSLPFPPLGQNASTDYFARWVETSTPALEFRHPTFRILKHARTWFLKAMDPGRERRFKSFSEALEDFTRVSFKRLRKGAEVYEFLEWLGKDRVGEIFRGQRLRDGHKLTIKRLSKDSYSARFAREVSILQDRPHPNLVGYLDFIEVRLGQEEREHYLVLEFLEGMPESSLRYVIKNSVSDLDPRFVLSLFLGYLDCLQHLHQRNILHRDLNPANLYAPADPAQAKVFDLGIPSDQEVTRTDAQLLGIPDYMPPEFASQGRACASPQSDLYSLGVTLYQALTRKLPFPELPEKESEAWLAFFRRAQAPPPCSFAHPIFEDHPELKAVLRQSLLPGARQRHPTAKAMRDALQDVYDRWPISSKRADQDAAIAQPRTRPTHAHAPSAEQPDRPPLEAPVQPPLPAQDTSHRDQYDAMLSAGRNALRQENYDEAEKAASCALELSPGDTVARQLLTEVRETQLKNKLYEVTMATARLALNHGNYEEAERHAIKALELRIGDAEAEKLLSQVRSDRPTKPSNTAFTAAIGAPAKAHDLSQTQARGEAGTKPEVGLASRPLSQAPEQQNKSAPALPNNQPKPASSGYEVIASWGDAKLIRYPGGNLELKDGTDKERLEAKEWISMYFGKAKVKEVP